MRFMRPFFVVVALPLVISCGTGIEEDSNSDKTVFRYNEAVGISKLDPSRTTSFEDIIAIGHLFEGLVTLDENLEVVPAIASSWEISEDGKEYTFYIRRDVYFHDNPVITKKPHQTNKHQGCLYHLCLISLPLFSAHIYL